jgi:hypothetical protein
VRGDLDESSFLLRSIVQTFVLNAHFPELTLEYAYQHPLDVLGREISQRDIDGYHNYRGEPMAPEPTGRSWGGAIKGFKETNKPL